MTLKQLKRNLRAFEMVMLAIRESIVKRDPDRGALVNHACQYGKRMRLTQPEVVAALQTPPIVFLAQLERICDRRSKQKEQGARLC